MTQSEPVTRAEYRREYRANNPDRQERDRLISKAHRTATKILIERRRPEFEQIKDEVKRDMGIEDRGKGGRPPLHTRT